MYASMRKIVARNSPVSSNSATYYSPNRQRICNSDKQEERSLGEQKNKKFDVDIIQLMQESRFARKNELEQQVHSIADKIEKHDLQFEKINQKLENILSLIDST